MCGFHTDIFLFNTCKIILVKFNSQTPELSKTLVSSVMQHVLISADAGKIDTPFFFCSGFHYSQSKAFHHNLGWMGVHMCTVFLDLSPPPPSPHPPFFLIFFFLFFFTPSDGNDRVTEEAKKAAAAAAALEAKLTPWVVAIAKHEETSGRLDLSESIAQQLLQVLQQGKGPLARPVLALLRDKVVPPTFFSLSLFRILFIA